MKSGINNQLEIKDGQFGRGVFAGADLTAGQVLEIVPIILVPKGNFKSYGDQGNLYCVQSRKPSDVSIQLSRYTFSWTSDLDAIALGSGSIYNHNRNHTVDYFQNILEQTITFVARVDIAKDEELFINYTYEPNFQEKHQKVQSQVEKTFNQDAQRWHKIVTENQELYREKERMKKVV